MRLIERGLLLTVVAATCALGATPALAWSAAGVALCLLFLGVVVLGALRDLASGWYLRWPVVFLLYCGIMTMLGPAPARSVFFVAQWSAWLAGGYVAFACARQSGARLLGSGLVVFALAQAVYGLVQYLTGHQKIFWYQKTKYLEDATGTYLNHNHLAGLLTLALPAALALGVPRLLARRAQGAPWCTASALILLGLVFSRSRMGMASALAALILYSVYLAVNSRRRVVWAWLAMLIMAATAYALWIGLEPVSRRFAALAQPGYLSVEGRLTLWRDTARLVAERPWLGWGPGMFPSVYPRVRTEPSDVQWMEAHNDYLQFLCELGMVGTAAFFGPLWTLVAGLARQAWRAPRLEGAWGMAIASGLAGILIHSFADFHFYVPANAVWIAVMTGLGAAEYISLRTARLRELSCTEPAFPRPRC